MTELEAAFKVHTDEMDSCVRSDCYWALLHLVVVIPDICGGLEASNGEATGAAYRDWCGRYLPAQPLTPDERYHVRCIVLHQGRTLASKGRYTYYKFTQPAPDGTSIHGFQPAPGQIVLDVGAMGTEMREGLRGWFAALQRPTEATRAAIVARNLSTLVTVKPQPLPAATGVMFTLNVTHTSTS